MVWIIKLTTLLRNGHGCMLQYALLHLFGYAVSMDDLKGFRVSDLSSESRVQE